MEFQWGLAFQTYFVFVLGLGILTALTLFLSLLVTPAAAVSIGVSFYGIMNLYGFYWSSNARQLPPLSRALSTVACYALPHLEFFDMRQRFVHDWPALQPGLLLFLFLYAACYVALFLFLSRLILLNKSIP